MRKTEKNESIQETKSRSNTRVYYAGFWSRLLAFVVDIFMIGLPITFIIMAIFGYESMQEANTLALLQGQTPENKPDPMIAFTQMSLSLLVYVGFWYQTGQTPGKKLAMIKVVDATTLQTASIVQLCVRFLSYFLSFITLVGFFLPLVLPKKQALHDLLSHTLVIYTTDS